VAPFQSSKIAEVSKRIKKAGGQFQKIEIHCNFQNFKCQKPFWQFQHSSLNYYGAIKTGWANIFEGLIFELFEVSVCFKTSILPPA